MAGVVAIQQIVDTDTGEVLEGSVVLAAHGELHQELKNDAGYRLR